MNNTLLIVIILAIVALVICMWSTSRENFNMATPDPSTFESINGIGPMSEDDISEAEITNKRKKPCNCK